MDFDSLDELLKEFHKHVNLHEVAKLSSQDARRISGAFSAYHRDVEPKRPLLKEIRNNLGSHRTALPWKKASRGPTTSSDEWGKWEQYLVRLEAECDLPDWRPTINSAIKLVNFLSDFNMDAWYSWPSGQSIRFYMPVLPPGYHPREPANSTSTNENGAA